MFLSISSFNIHKVHINCKYHFKIKSNLPLVGKVVGEIVGITDGTKLVLKIWIF